MKEMENPLVKRSWSWVEVYKKQIGPHENSSTIKKIILIFFYIYIFYLNKKNFFFLEQTFITKYITGLTNLLIFMILFFSFMAKKRWKLFFQEKCIIFFVPVRNSFNALIIFL